jgi:hypothetical protein
MKTPSRAFPQKLRRVLRPVVREAAYKHNPLLIDRLAEFNFRPRLDLPGEQPARMNGFSQ